MFVVPPTCASKAEGLNAMLHHVDVGTGTGAVPEAESVEGKAEATLFWTWANGDVMKDHG